MDEKEDVTAVISIEGEILALENISTANAKISIENWLFEVKILD